MKTELYVVTFDYTDDGGDFLEFGFMNAQEADEVLARLEKLVRDGVISSAYVGPVGNYSTTKRTIQESLAEVEAQFAE